MKPQRPYNLQMRRISADMTRLATVRAAMELLGGDQAHKFSMDAVASKAGISRMTVFNLFGDKRSLLLAVYDALSNSGQLDDVTDILNDADVTNAWARYVQRFAQFYQSHGAVLRHVRGLAALDADFDAVMRQRDARKDLGISWLLQRQHGCNPLQAMSPALQALTQQVSALMGFEVLQALTERAGSEQAVVLWRAMVDAVRWQAIARPAARLLDF